MTASWTDEVEKFLADPSSFSFIEQRENHVFDVKLYFITDLLIPYRGNVTDAVYNHDCTHTFHVSAPDTLQAAEQMFTSSNEVSIEHECPLRSLSVGDIIEVSSPDGNVFYRVGRVGFVVSDEPRILQ